MTGIISQYIRRVTYADCTDGNHVYYGNFARFLEEARGEMFRSAGRTFLEWQQQEILFPVIELRMLYKLPARYDELIIVVTRVVAAEGVRLRFGYTLTNERGAVVLQAETEHVCTNLQGRPRRLPSELAARLWMAERSVGVESGLTDTIKK